MMAAPRPENWVQLRAKGLYVLPGDFYVDPTSAVDAAIVTHGHGDHARPGHRRVAATLETLEIMSARLGAAKNQRRHHLGFGERIQIADVSVWLAPAGHILGSAQVVLEHKGSRVVVSGDYKRQPDPTCPPFEPVSCDVFVTESTFGLPVFRHPDSSGEVAKLLHSVSLFPERCHLVGVYALGKAQRMIALIREAGYDKPIYVHATILKLCKLYGRFGIDLGSLLPITSGLKEQTRAAFQGQILLAPPSTIADHWSKCLPDPIVVMASGWMQTKKRVKQRGVELPLVISDHADWDQLYKTFEDVGAPEIWVTHGREEAIVHQASNLGYRARALQLVGCGQEN